MSRLRPLSAGDIVDEAIGLYRRNFRLFLTIGAIALVPAGIVQLLLALAGDNENVGYLALSSLLSLLVSAVSYVIVIAAMAVAASERWFDRPMTVGMAYSRAFERIWEVAGLVIVYGLVLGGLTITIIGFPFAIYFGVAWLLSLQVLLVERAGIGDALGRSRDLVTGHWWRVIGIAILLLIIQLVISFFFTIPAAIAGFGSLWSDPTSGDVSPLVAALDTIGSTAGRIVTGPIAYCAYILMYYDLRVRKEGLDIELTARSLGLIDAPAGRHPGPSF